MKNQQIDSKKVFETLKNADWYYEHCGDRIKEGDMDEYIYEIEQGLSLELVSEILNSQKVRILGEYEDGDINEFAAKIISDSVAQSIVDCVYPSVSFII